MTTQTKPPAEPGQATPKGQPRPEEDNSLNTSVTEDDRTEGGPLDESGKPKLDTGNDI